MTADDSPPVELWPPVWLDAPPEPAGSVDWLAEHLLATHTGADAPTGAAADTAGLTLVEPTCAAPTDSEVLWAGWLCPPPVVEASEPACPLDWPVEHRLRAQTGADAPIGTAADMAGLAFVDASCAEPTECEAFWPAGRLRPPSVVEAVEPAGPAD